MFGKGISTEGDLIDLAVEKGIVQKSGAWYTMGDERLGQGRESAKKTLIDNPELTVKIDKLVRDILFPKEGTEAE